MYFFKLNESCFLGERWVDKVGARQLGPPAWALFTYPSQYIQGQGWLPLLPSLASPNMLGTGLLVPWLMAWHGRGNRQGFILLLTPSPSGVGPGE